MAVRKRTPARRKTTTVRKKPTRFKSDANTQTGARPVASGAPQKGTRGARSTTTTTTRKRRTVKKATPKKTTARKTGSKKIILSAKNQKTAEKLYKMSDKKAAKTAAKIEAKKTSAKKIPKGRVGALIAGGATLIGGLSALRNKPKTFGEAFKKARKSKGPNATFTYKGKKYSTVTKDQIKKAGYSNLRDYLNAQKKKK